jgi:uncharacterized membrane protein
MPLGPVEVLVVKFPGNQFTGEITPALAELVESDTIHVIDLVFIHKDENGEVTKFELADLTTEEAGTYEELVEDVGLLNEDDIEELAGMLDNNSSAAMMLFENVWATRFRDAVLEAKGEVVANFRIPHALVEAAWEAHLAEA